jgi:ribosome maturation factor RimP
MSEKIISIVKEAILPLVESKDCYLDDIVFEKENNEWYLRIFVDKNEGSLDMDTCVEVTDLVSAKLDEIDPINQEYYLEISSPGLERPLKTFEAVQKSVGEYVYIELKDPKNGLSELYGTILSIEDGVLNMDYMVKNIHKKCAIEYANIKFIRMAVKF